MKNNNIKKMEKIYSIKEASYTEWNSYFKNCTSSNIVQSWQYGNSKKSSSRWDIIRFLIFMIFCIICIMILICLVFLPPPRPPHHPFPPPCLPVHHIPLLIFYVCFVLFVFS